MDKLILTWQSRIQFVIFLEKGKKIECNNIDSQWDREQEVLYWFFISMG